MYDYILFDLDGTIVRSEKGIFNSIYYAAEKFGLPKPEAAALRPFIGPPLQYSFQNFYGVSEDTAKKMVDVYREYYAEKGVFECELYDGVGELIADLAAAGRRVVLATSKPDRFARIILEHFGLIKYFYRVSAAGMSAESSEKGKIIAAALKMCGEPERSRALMIGDRGTDMSGAKKNGIAGLGVLYGYGTERELREAGAAYLAKTPADIRKITLDKGQ